MRKRRAYVWAVDSPVGQETRIERLKAAGFSEYEIEIMKNMRLYPHWVKEQPWEEERYSDAASKLYHQRIETRNRLAKELGISVAEAAKQLRERIASETEEFRELMMDPNVLPSEYDPLVQMEYRPPTIGVM